jgi:pseudaminic acid cytidylyltransferase
MNVAIIPARGGSRRIPKKNILPFCGKPMIAHSIETALSSGLFERVIVSTDNEEIGEISELYGAEVPFMRSAELSNDFIGTHEVTGDAVKFLVNSGVDVKYACCIYATAPLIQLEDLKKGYHLLKEGNWTNVFAATEFSYPIFRSFQYSENGGLEMFFPEHYPSRSQDLPTAMHDAGQFYWSNAETWMQPPKGFNKSSTVVLLPNWRVQDIDTIDDWKRAENIYRLQTEET